MAEVSLELLSRQLERLLDGQAQMRDDMTVVLGRIDHVEKVIGARLEILDESLKLIQTELMALRRRDVRLGHRLERLEAEAAP